MSVWEVHLFLVHISYHDKCRLTTDSLQYIPQIFWTFLTFLSKVLEGKGAGPVGTGRRKQVERGLLGLVGAAVAVALLCLGLPVVLGTLLAVALDPVVRGLQRQTGLGRRGSAGLTVTLTLVVLGAVLWGLGRVLLHEAAGLSQTLPEVLGALSRYAAQGAALLESLGQRLPDGAGDALVAWGQGLLSTGGTLAQSLYEKVFSLVTRCLGALPDSLFFLMTLVLSTYFAAGELPRLRDLVRQVLPDSAQRWLEDVGRSVRLALGGWVRAQLGLMGVTFLTLTVGLLLLRVGSPVLLALGISLLDALPVFGTGTVLLPWALLTLLRGNLGRALGLLGLYGAATLLRNILEPKVLGKTLGLSPLLTLLAVYAGWKLMGLWGMLLLPMGTMILSQLLTGAKPQT
jgi:sporulation integral membrane protein YtvI